MFANPTRTRLRNNNAYNLPETSGLFLGLVRGWRGVLVTLIITNVFGSAHSLSLDSLRNAPPANIVLTACQNQRFYRPAVVDYDQLLHYITTLVAHLLPNRGPTDSWTCFRKRTFP
ncbi:hypothetical protein KM043_010352 [Ampulex compressa]|nr:hypothetical protein KM043_010352 [Ampulex compressa]